MLRGAAVVILAEANAAHVPRIPSPNPGSKALDQFSIGVTIRCDAGS